MRYPRGVLAALVLAAAGCSGPAVASSPAAAPTTATAAPTAEPITLLTHCGIRYADFHGHLWEAITPAPEPPPIPDTANNIVRYNGHTAGTMTLLAPDLARFDAATGTGPVTVDFRPLSGPRQLCA